MDKSLWVSIIGAVMSVLYSFITSEWQAGGGWRSGQQVEPRGGMRPCKCFPSHCLGIGFGGQVHIEPHLSMLRIHGAPRSRPERQRGG